MKAPSSLSAIFFTLFLASPAAHASGVLVPTDKSLPPLAIKHQRVEIDVKDGVANARVEQVFKNSVDRDLEAVFVFPMPKGAAISDFAMHINGKRMSGEIVNKDKARKIYQDIVRRMKDPGLLEHLGNDLFRVSIYPVPKQGEQRIEISYSQALEYDGGLYKLVYPLKTGEKASQTLEDFTMGVRLSSQVPLKNIYSPSHDVGVNRKSDHQASIGFEEDRSVLDRDFVLYYGVSNKDFGLNMLTYAEDKKDGYFMMMIAPEVVGKEEKRIERDVVFVFDTSGSMRGEKIEQAREALKYCVGKLEKGDRFNIVRFSTEAYRFSEELVEVNEDNVKKALAFTSDIAASGGTAIQEAMTSGLGLWDEDRPFTLVFLTDGKPTIGESNPDKILEAVHKAADSDKIRVFAFGVGEDLNTHLLDRISGENGGTSQYIRGKEKIDAKVASFYQKISFPVLTQPMLQVDGVKITGLHPKKLPDLFAGEQITVFGRYHGNGDHAIRLTGQVNGKKREFVYESNLPKKNVENHFIPRLWATRHIGYLLDEIRLRGENSELKDEVIALSSEFGIVTPYTSYLVLENDKEYSKHGIDRTLAGKKSPQPADPAAIQPAGDGEVDSAQLAGRRANRGVRNGFLDSRQKARSKPGWSKDESRATESRESNEGLSQTTPNSTGAAPGNTNPAVPAARAAVPVFPSKQSNNSKPAAEGEPAKNYAFPSDHLPHSKDGKPSKGFRQKEIVQEDAEKLLKRSDGATAVDLAEKIREYKETAKLGPGASPAAMRHVGKKIFYRINGVWTDRDYKVELKTKRLVYASDEYLEYLSKHPELKAFFTLGENVIVVLADGSALIVAPPKEK